jgi:uncharacterized membrane protein YeiH
MAAMLGMLTGLGGGMLRDLLVREIPVVLRDDLYASAALAGGSIIVLAPLLHVPPAVAALSSGVVCLALRFGAIRYGWRLPAAHSLRPEGAEPDGSDDGRDERSSR